MKKGDLLQIIREEILEFGMQRINIKDLYKSISKGDTVNIDNKNIKILNVTKNEIKTDKGTFLFKNYGSGPEQWELTMINNDPVLIK